MKKLFLIVIILSTVTTYGQTVPKKITLSKGQQLEQKSQVKLNMTLETMGQTIENQIESDKTSLIEVKETDATGYGISNTLKRVLVNVTSMGQEMKFDSEKKEDMDSQIGVTYRDKIGKSKEYKINIQGIITEVKNKGKVNEAEGMMGSLMGIEDEDKEGSTFRAFANIPLKELKVGDTWTDSLIDGKNKTISSYALKEIANGNGVVSFNRNLVVYKDTQVQGMSMIVDLKGNSKGEYTFETASGIVTSRKSTTKANGTMEMSGQSIPVTMETTNQSTISKK